MKININDEIIVRLTKHGERMWAAHWNRYTDYGAKIPWAIEREARQPDGRVRFQIHELMNIFGLACYNGSVTLPFEKNELEISE